MIAMAIDELESWLNTGKIEVQPWGLNPGLLFMEAFGLCEKYKDTNHAETAICFALAMAKNPK